MIAVIAAATNVAAAKQVAAVPPPLPFNWFDLAVIGILIFGLIRGRNNGMSREVLPLFQWVCILVAGSLGYPIAAQFFTNTMKMDKLWSAVLGYVALALVVMIIFTILKRLFTERLAKSDTFKGGEYYLGMLAGLARYACILLIAMALLNAPVYTQAEIDARATYLHQVYGGGQPGFSGDYVPSLQQIQDQVLAKSFTGPVVKARLSPLLIVGGEVSSITNQPSAAPAAPPPPPKPKPKITIG